MSDQRSTVFERVRNGDSDEFPEESARIFALDGYPELLNLVVEWREKYRIFAFEDVTRQSLHESPFECSTFGRHCDGKTLCLVDRSLIRGSMATFSNGSFKSRSIMLPPKTVALLRHDGSTYFIVDSDSDFYLVPDGASEPFLSCPKQADGSLNAHFCFVGNDFVMVYSNGDSTPVKFHALNDGAFLEERELSVPFSKEAVLSLEDQYLVIFGDSQLAIIDCKSMEVVIFTFPKFEGKILNWTARLCGNVGELYVSTRVVASTFIWKTSIPVEFIKGDSTSNQQAYKVPT